MALLRIDFHSNYLDRNVIVTAVIPADKMDGDRLAKGRRSTFSMDCSGRTTTGLIKPMS